MFKEFIKFLKLFVLNSVKTWQLFQITAQLNCRLTISILLNLVFLYVFWAIFLQDLFDVWRSFCFEEISTDESVHICKGSIKYDWGGGLSFTERRKIYAICTECHNQQNFPEDILECLDLSKDDFMSNLLLVLDIITLSESTILWIYSDFY